MSAERTGQPDRDPSPPGRSGPRRGTLRFLLLESLVVIFSVLVALAVDGWRESARRAERADRARHEVLSEAAANLEELLASDSIISGRRARLQGLEERMAAAEAPFDEASFGGFWAPDLRRAAWERLSRSELAAELPPDFLDEAFRLYQLNGSLGDLTARIHELVFSPLNHRPEDARVAWSIADDILRQQLAWIDLSIDLHRAFLDR